MPTIATFGAAGARAYGHLGRGLLAKVLKSLTFTTSQTWIAPATTMLITQVSGYGAAGNPDTRYTNPSTYTIDTYAASVYDNGASSDPANFVRSDPDGPIPSFFCYPFSSYTTNGHFNRCICFEYHRVEHPGTSGGSAPTTGASASAFGNTFPGGFAGAATPASFSGIAVTPNTPYLITVPPGASVTINYFE